MTQEEIIEGNKLIAEFMGSKVSFKEGYSPTEYHSSWNWLMPVVEKIEDTDGTENLSYGHSVIIDNWDCIIKDCLSGEIRCDINPLNKTITSKIDSVWYAVIEFIKWYNNKNKQQ